MDSMVDPFNEGGVPAPAAAPRTSPPPQGQNSPSLQDIQRMIVATIQDYDNQRRAEDDRRRAEEMEQIRGMMKSRERVEQAEPVRAAPIVVRPEQKPDYLAQFAAEDGRAVPVEEAEKPFGAMDKEPVAIIGSIFTILAAVAPLVGITLTAEEINAFVVGISALVSAVVLVIGTVATVWERSKANSPATVARLKKGKL